jgi:RimJ/RimL family protein N-acetyltransferase
MQDIELLGPRVRIRRARIGDAEARFRWFADALVTEYLPLAGERVLPMTDILAFLGQASRDDAPDFSAEIELLSGRVIGCGGLRGILPGGSAEISVVIGERDVWGSGYAREAMQLLLQFGFERLNLNRIWLVVRTENARAVRLFKRLGFVVAETLVAAAIVGGIARDKFRMELTKEEWRSLGRGADYGQ